MLPALFLERPNRFRVEARLESGGDVSAHLANPGRMVELFTPERRLLLVPRDAIHRVTSQDLAFFDVDGRLVSADTRWPVRLVREALLEGRLPDFPGVRTVRGEVKVGASRLDFLIEDALGGCLIEVKSVNLVEAGLALFPDAPTSRGRRHVKELTHIAQTGGRAAVVFVVQRDDAQAVAPFWASDPAFAQALVEAAAAGVQVLAYGCSVTQAEIRITTRLPVVLDLPVERAA